MDAVSLILSALSSGAAKAATESATDAVGNAYSKLKTLVARRFTGHKAAEAALAEHASDPETWQAPLAKVLAESGAGDDPAIVEAAQKLMALLDEAGSQTGKYRVNLSGARGVQIGDGNRQVNMFTDP